MVFNLVDVKRLGKKFSIDRKVRTPHIRVDCDNCPRWDSLVSYEGDIHERDFSMPYYECKECNDIFCQVCLDEKCPTCDGVEFFRIKPLHIYVCNSCVNEKERACPECRYPDLEETFLFSY